MKGRKGGRGGDEWERKGEGKEGELPLIHISGYATAQEPCFAWMGTMLKAEAACRENTAS